MLRVMLLVLMLTAPKLWAQGFSVSQDGVNVGGSTSGHVYINFRGTACVISKTGTVYDFNCNAGGGGGGVPGGSNTNVQFNNSGAFGGISNGTLGQVLISQGPSTPPAFADPLVQGTQAAGSTTQPNPVLGGVWDGTTLRAILGDSSGRATVNINGTIPISGSLSVSNFPASQVVTGTFWQSLQPVSIASMPTTPVTGTFWQTTQPVSGTFWQTTQPVSGPLTDTQLRATPVPVSGTVTATGPLTDTQLRATPVPVSGTITASGPLTDTQLRATPVPVSGTVTANISGSINNTSFTATQATGTNLHTVVDSGSVTAAATLAAETTKVIGTVNVSSGQTVGLAAGSAVIGHVINDASSAVIGHVVADSGSTTAVTGNVASTVADGANVVLGAKADAKSTATDTTAITMMQVMKEISAMEQAPASRAVTNAGTFAVQVTSAPSTAVTNAGTFAVQATMTSGNPCTTGTLTGVAGATSGTSLTQLVALSGTTKIYVCSAIFTSVSGTSPTISLAYGTGSACATGTVTFYGPTAAQTVGAISGAATPFNVTPAGQALCYKGAGTSPVFNYTITYVQQ